MLIGLNGQVLLIKDPAGPELYTYNIFKALARIDQKNNYVVYFSEKPSTEYWAELCVGNPNFKYKVVEKKGSWTQIGLALELFRHPVDVFFTAVHTMPLIRNPKMKVVGMIHGLEYTFNVHAGLLKQLLRGKHEWYVAKFSSVLVVPSEHTKKEILKKGWVSEKKIVVVNEGVDPRFYKRGVSEVANFRIKYKLGDGDYLSFVSTIQPRKNLPKFIEGFSLALKELGGDNIKLVVAGKLGWSYQESLDAPKKFGIPDNVLFTGRLLQEDLPVFLSGAKAFVSPSLEEGFGLPLLEAMACEVPCLVSDIEGFRELGKDSVVYFDPNNSGDIKNKIVDLFDRGYSADFIHHAKENSLLYTWDRAAQKIVEIFSSSNAN